MEIVKKVVSAGSLPKERAVSQKKEQVRPITMGQLDTCTNYSLELIHEMLYYNRIKRLSSAQEARGEPTFSPVTALRVKTVFELQKWCEGNCEHYRFVITPTKEEFPDEYVRESHIGPLMPEGSFPECMRLRPSCSKSLCQDIQFWQDFWRREGSDKEQSDRLGKNAPGDCRLTCCVGYLESFLRGWDDSPHGVADVLMGRANQLLSLGHLLARGEQRQRRALGKQLIEMAKNHMELAWKAYALPKRRPY